MTMLNLGQSYPIAEPFVSSDELLVLQHVFVQASSTASVHMFGAVGKRFVQLVLSREFMTPLTCAAMKGVPSLTRSHGASLGIATCQPSRRLSPEDHTFDAPV